MSKTKRNRYSGEFKAKVAREAMREGSTIVEIAARYNIHPNQVSEWKKQGGLVNRSVKSHQAAFLSAV
jgi:transposase